MNLNSVIFRLLQDEKRRKSFERTIISQQTQACHWTLKWRRNTYLNGSRSMGDGKKWMLTKLARAALEIPFPGKERKPLYTHTHAGGEEGNGVWWGLLQMFKNFSAKTSACRKTKQTNNLPIPAMEEWPNCFHRWCCCPALPQHWTRQSSDGRFCPCPAKTHEISSAELDFW